MDESHIGVPQVGGMFKGDRARKDSLVEYGFRLPSALDNRPLTFEEFETKMNQVIYVSATPRDYELRRSEGLIVEQVVRPTGLVDPEVEVRPAGNQVDDLLEEIRLRAEKGERVLVTTLTKRMAEDLTSYYQEVGVRVKYMHSDVDTLERINLLREGLDIPEVSLVAVLDADKEGYLRSEPSLVQTSGRAARNVNGRVIFYADTVTGSMKAAMGEMERRREKQIAHNEEHGITPRTIQKALQQIEEIMPASKQSRYAARAEMAAEDAEEYVPFQDLDRTIVKLRKKMKEAADAMNFEEAAVYRDRVLALERRQIEEGV